MGFSSFFLVKRDCSLNYQRKFDVPKTNEEKSLRFVNLAKLLLTGFDVENIIFYLPLPICFECFCQCDRKKIAKCL